VEPEGPAAPQVDGRLAVREEAEAFLVVREGDPEDWLARFDKGEGFPAREWAENMARIYNRRLQRRSVGPPIPPGTRPPSYHPGSER
jgi:hypothetical protein